MSTSPDWRARLFGDAEDAAEHDDDADDEQQGPEPVDVNADFRERLLAASTPVSLFDLRDRGTINPHR